MQDLNTLDDATLALAHQAAESKYKTNNSLENFKVVARFRYQTNLRRFRASQNKIPLDKA